jgi:hypothetical protein
MARWLRFDIVGCVACRKDGRVNRQYEHHHLNFNGKAGQKRLGHDFTIPLCGWHHVGRPPEGHDSKWAETNFRSVAREAEQEVPREVRQRPAFAGLHERADYRIVQLLVERQLTDEEVIWIEMQRFS